jgi:UDP-3-O-[3-hydroxymyristoyl] glucosamine N-acyltransferase LpxD
MGHVTASDIALFLQAPLIGKNLVLIGVSSLDTPIKDTVVFSKNNRPIVENHPTILLIGPFGTADRATDYSENITLIEVQNPRLSFGKVLSHFFITKTTPNIHTTAVIASSADIHPSVSIGAHTVIEDGVKIDAGTIIKHNVIISKNVKIGKNCYIKSGSIIGEDGFGFDFEEDRIPFRIPHIGSVCIGNNVEIGSNVTVARGTLINTTIEDHVKIDDHVHIAHNCKIGEKSIITACAELSGGVLLEGHNWIGPNSSILQKITIGGNSTVGIGSVVTRDVLPHQKVMGFASMPLKELINAQRKIQ